MKRKFKIFTLCATFGLSCTLLAGCVSNVSFENGSFSKDASEIKVALKDGEAEKLEKFTQLQVADLSLSENPAEIFAWAQKHENVDVKYTVALPDGTDVNNDASSLDLTGFTHEDTDALVEAIKLLPDLKEVSLSSSFSRENLESFVNAAPEIKFNYEFTILGSKYDLGAESISFESLNHSSVAELLDWLPFMKELKSVDLGAELADDSLSFDDIAALEEAAPNADFEYVFSLFGQERRLSDSSLNLSHIPMEDNGELALKVAKLMPNLTILDMDSCGVPDERMAEIRDALPDVNVVWRIWFGPTSRYSVRTDVERILASNPGIGGDITHENTESLKYCTKVKYLDLGHNTTLDTIEFVRYMPDLEVAILAMNCWSDLSPLENCEKLNYLEIQTGAVSDLRPLAKLKNLRDLNICYNFAIHDISPLFELTELDRLWIGCYTPVPPEQIEQMRECAPNCEIDTEVVDPTSGTWRYLGYDEYGFMQVAPRYKQLREELRYDLGPAAYSYSWNDPLC